MFFCPELLLPQFGGKFSEAWIADVRGIAYMKKKDVLKVDIPQLCDDIIEILDYRRKRPEECLSLMIACRLVHGVFILFDNKITILLDNIIKFSFKCRIPEPRSPKKSKEQGDDVVSRKRKRKDKSESRVTNEHVRVDQAAQDDGLANLVPLHSITLNELPLEAMTGVRDFQSEVLNFGDLGFSAHPDPMAFDDVVFPLVEEVESSKKRAPSDVPTTPTKKRAVEKPMSQFDAIEKSISQVEDPEMQIPRSPFKIAEKPVTPLPVVETSVAPPQEEQPNGANSIDLINQRHIKAGNKKKKGPNLSVPYCMNEKSNKCIDRRLVEVKKQVLQVPEFTLFRKHVSVNVPNILALLFDKEPHIDHIYRKPQSLSQVDSLLDQKFASKHTTLQHTDLPSVVEVPHEQSDQIFVPVEDQTPLFANLNTSGLEGKESQVEDPPGQSHQFTVPVEVHAPHFTETNISALDGREQFQPLAESSAIPVPAQVEFIVSAVEPIEIEKSPFEINLPQNEDVRKLMRHQRHKYIRHIVKKWDYEKNGKLTLEDVCPKPLNRFNMAATFGDLLIMSKHDYVVLNTKEDTLELESIEKGKKLLE